MVISFASENIEHAHDRNLSVLCLAPPEVLMKREIETLASVSGLRYASKNLREKWDSLSIWPVSTPTIKQHAHE